MSPGFVKKGYLLREDSRVEDLLDISKSVDKYESLIGGLRNSSIIGIVGPFGSGKSTMLYQVEKRLCEGLEWVNFDAWKYPDRKDMWEGFLLDFADQIGRGQKVKNQVDGKTVKTAVATILSPIVASFAALPGLDKIAERFGKLFADSRASRVFELHEIFRDMLQELRRTIVVVEDIDRSGDHGVYFLETLKQFMGTLPRQSTLVAVVPIGDEKYQSNSDSYFKCLDIVERFRPDVPGLSKFVDAVFDSELFEGEHKYTNGKVAWKGIDRRGQVISFLEQLLTFDQITIRTLKLILRNAQQVYCQQEKDSHEPDFRVTIGFEASKFLIHTNERFKNWFEYFRHEKRVPSNCLMASFLQSMAAQYSTITVSHSDGTSSLVESMLEWKIIPRKGPNGPREYPSWPWVSEPRFRVEGEPQGCLPDFYLSY